jgi:hypothetical protein
MMIFFFNITGWGCIYFVKKNLVNQPWKNRSCKSAMEKQIVGDRKTKTYEEFEDTKRVIRI